MVDLQAELAVEVGGGGERMLCRGGGDGWCCCRLRLLLGWWAGLLLLLLLLLCFRELGRGTLIGEVVAADCWVLDFLTRRWNWEHLISYSFVHPEHQLRWSLLLQVKSSDNRLASNFQLGLGLAPERALVSKASIRQYDWPAGIPSLLFTHEWSRLDNDVIN